MESMVRKKINKNKNPINNWTLVLMMCAWLGLAPYFPEPHIWGKLKWIAGGAHDMKLIDWGDFIMHGFPWLLLGRLVFLKFKPKVVKV
tara:strand:+ start:50686 stop:50949 length:264 start_codon:yes stop_codon:yes gene_type:complete